MAGWGLRPSRPRFLVYQCFRLPVVSSLWTPDGERPVGRPSEPGGPGRPAPAGGRRRGWRRPGRTGRGGAGRAGGGHAGRAGRTPRSRWWWPTTATGCSSWPRSTCPSSPRCSTRPGWPSMRWAAWSRASRVAWATPRSQLKDGLSQLRLAYVQIDGAQRAGAEAASAVGVNGGSASEPAGHRRPPRPTPTGERGPDAARHRRSGSGPPDPNRAGQARSRRAHRRLPGPELHRSVHRTGRPAGQPGRLGRGDHPLRAAAGLRGAGGHLRPDRRPPGQLAHLPGGRTAERPNPEPGGPAHPLHGGSLIAHGRRHLDVHRGQRVLAPGADDPHRRPGIGRLHPHQRGRGARGVRSQPVDQGPPAHHRARDRGQPRHQGDGASPRGSRTTPPPGTCPSRWPR